MSRFWGTPINDDEWISDFEPECWDSDEDTDKFDYECPQCADAPDNYPCPVCGRKPRADWSPEDEAFWQSM